MTELRRWPFALLLALTVSASSPADDLTTLTGKKLNGKLVAVNVKGITFRTEAGDVPVAAKEIATIDLGNKIASPAADAKFDEVELTDGSLFRTARILIKSRKVEVVPQIEGANPAIDIPLGTVFSMLRSAEDPKNRDDWRKLLASRGKRDLYVIRGADGLNFLRGTLLEGTETGEAVSFEREDGTKSMLKLSRATGGLVFNQPPQGQLPPTLCKVLDVYGNVLVAQSVDFDGGKARVLTVAGAAVDYPDANQIAKLDFSQGNVVYLSDLEPQVVSPEPVAGEPNFTFLRDKNQDGAALRLENTAYERGLWVYPDTALTFTLAGDFREFKAVLGIDDAVQLVGSAVKVTIEADGRVLFSDVIRRKDKPKPITLDVKGAKTLRLVVEPDAVYLGGQLNLADARVQK